MYVSVNAVLIFLPGRTLISGALWYGIKFYIGRAFVIERTYEGSITHVRK